ncbi:hypothetical protein Tco_1118746 [Tanacetum coccineum]
MTKTNDISPKNSPNINRLNFFDTPYFPNLNLADTLPNDDAEAESENNDGESSVFGSISNSISESLDNDATTYDTAHSSVSGRILNSISESFDNDATTYDIAHSSTNDNTVELGSTSEGNNNILNIQSEPITQRRSGRVSKLPTKLSEYVLDEKVKYGIQRHVNYSHLSKENYCWPLFQLDVNNTFLYGNLAEDVYMTLPPGYFSMGDNRNGFQQSKSDYSLFIKAKNNVYITLLVYANDIVITGNNLDEVNQCKNLKTDQGICLSQRKYCMELLTEYGLLACKPASTPIESKLVITDKPINKKDKSLKNITEYQKMLGKLIYLTHIILHYPCFHSLNPVKHSPLSSSLKLGALRRFQVLEESPEKVLHISKTTFCPNGYVTCYVGKKYNKCKAMRRFVTGFSVFFIKSLVSWKSKKQNVVARSSAKAEYRALATVTCKIMWLLNLLIDFKLETEKPVPIFCDNKAALQIAVNPVFHDKTKHFEIDLHFVRDKIIEGIIKPSKIESANNLADMFTKGLSADQLTHLLEGLNLFDPFKT